MGNLISVEEEEMCCIRASSSINMQGEGDQVVMWQDDSLTISISCPSNPQSLTATITDSEVLQKH